MTRTLNYDDINSQIKIKQRRCRASFTLCSHKISYIDFHWNEEKKVCFAYIRSTNMKIGIFGCWHTFDAFICYRMHSCSMICSIVCNYAITWNGMILNAHDLLQIAKQNANVFFWPDIDSENAHFSRAIVIYISWRWFCFIWRMWKSNDFSLYV